jgi:hypothetical protein
MFVNPFPSPYANPFPGMNTIQSPQPVQNQIPMMPEANLPRALTWGADQSGCFWYRVGFPSFILNAHMKMTIHNSTIMNFHPQYFAPIKSVRIQRQATEPQLQFVKWLKDLSKQFGFRIIYEIDDIIFSEDIPSYNKYKPAFDDPNIRRVAQETMALCDEITVTCKFMKDYYHEKTGNSNITVVPNYPPKFWMGHYYNENKLRFNFDKYCTGKKTKPRILYPGSGAHFDVDNRVGQNDDFAHVREVIAKTARDFQWVFIGAYPPPLHNFIKDGLIEFHPWKRFLEYPQMIYDLNVNALIAPLQDNNFNKAKSDLKFIEGCCYGIPVICQDLCTYENAFYKFKTGPEMIDQIKLALKSGTEYMQHAKKVRKIAESRFLENDENIDKYVELYTLPYKDSGRKLLNSINL